MTISELPARTTVKGPQSSKGPNGPMVPLTVDQYHQMIGAGILLEGEPIELLNGFLVRKDRSEASSDPMTVGHRHAVAVGALSELNPKLKRFGCHMRIQQPVTIPDFDEPEPDGAIVKGVRTDYTDHHPGPAEIFCVIEVADSSLAADRLTKQQIYANAGVGQYVIVNLPDRVVEVYTVPLPGRGRYAESTTLRVGQKVDFFTSPAGGKGRLTVAVRSLLP